MKENYGYCGVNCHQCKDYLENKCPGCKQSKWDETTICDAVECCKNQHISSCGLCATFPCEKMKMFFKESQSHEEAYHYLKSLKK